MTIGILLSGCGVYDGTEIQEAVLSMLAITEAGHDYKCISVNKNQYHVVNHLTGETMDENRNMMVESARIARGEVQDINEISPAIIDGLVIPGGFGAAKNFTTWAFNGPDSDILPEVKLLIVNLVNAGKPIAALCVSPVVIAKALQNSNIQPTLTLGTTKEQSPYNIEDFHKGVESIGAKTEEKPITDILVDYDNKIITAPCYMMNANILEVKNNIKKAVNQLIKMI
jgi:enhancing lycopene biosynthesis protein 2